jgi:hypothetical protein
MPQVKDKLMGEYNYLIVDTEEWVKGIVFRIGVGVISMDFNEESINSRSLT